MRDFRHPVVRDMIADYSPDMIPMAEHQVFEALGLPRDHTPNQVVIRTE
jgi:hypothetical protein